MIETYIPDYTSYKTDELIDVYVRIDKINNPTKTQAIELELRKRLDIEPDIPINENLIKKMYSVFHQKESIIRIKDSKYGNMIKGAWIGGLISATITLLMFIFSLLGESSEEISIVYKVSVLIDILVMYGLTYGIFRKSRVCAVTILLFFILGKINALLSGSISLMQFALSSILSLVLIGLFIGGIIGTFSYHKNNIEDQVEQTA